MDERRDTRPRVAMRLSAGHGSVRARTRWAVESRSSSRTATRPRWLQDELLGFLGKLDHGEARSSGCAGNTDLRRQLRLPAWRLRHHRRFRRPPRTHGQGQHRRRRPRDLPSPAGARLPRVRWVPQAIVRHAFRPRSCAAAIPRPALPPGTHRKGRRSAAAADASRPYLIAQWLRALGRATSAQAARRRRASTRCGWRWNLDLLFLRFSARLDARPRLEPPPPPVSLIGPVPMSSFRLSHLHKLLRPRDPRQEYPVAALASPGALLVGRPSRHPRPGLRDRLLSRWAPPSPSKRSPRRDTSCRFKFAARSSGTGSTGH